MSGELRGRDCDLPVEEFCRPLPLLALAVMAINDHFLRVHWPCWVTGKISDFAVVLFFPALVTSSLDLSLLAYNRLAATIGFRPANASLTCPKIFFAAFATAIALSAINLSTTARDLYVWSLYRLDVFHIARGFSYTVDPTDLIALAALPLAVLDARNVVRRIPARRISWILALDPGKMSPRELVAHCLQDVRKLARARGETFSSFCALETSLSDYLAEPSERHSERVIVRLRDYRAVGK